MQKLKIKPGRLASVLGGAVVAAAMLLVIQGASGARPAEALTNCTVSDMTFDSEEQKFLQLINNYRAQNGKPALSTSVNLNRAASWLAVDMATKKYFSHTDSAGREMATRIANCDGVQYNGENLAAGTVRDTAQEAFDAWRNSSSHNANMLNASYNQIGIARHYDAASPYKWYWVTDFSTTNDGTNASTGSTGGSGGSSGGSTTPPPAPPASSTKAVMTSPVNGATLTTNTTFSWSAANGAQGYHIYIGTSQGSSNMLSAATGTRTSASIRGFPSTGQTVYLRLWTQTSSGWQYNDYTYRLP